MLENIVTLKSTQHANLCTICTSLSMDYRTRFYAAIQSEHFWDGLTPNIRT